MHPGIKSFGKYLISFIFHRERSIGKRVCLWVALRLEVDDLWIQDRSQYIEAQWLGMLYQHLPLALAQFRSKDVYSQERLE